MSCSSLTTGRLRRGGPDRDAIAGRRRARSSSTPRRPLIRTKGPARRARRGTSRPSSPRGGRRSFRWSMSADNKPTLPLLRRRRVATSSSSSATRQAPSLAPTSKLGSTNSAQPRWSSAGPLRLTRSKRRCGTPAILAIRSLWWPTRVRRPRPSMSKAGALQRRACVRSPGLIRAGRGPRLSMLRLRSKPRRRPKPAKDASRPGLDRAAQFHRRRPCSFLRATKHFQRLKVIFLQRECRQQ